MHGRRWLPSVLVALALLASQASGTAAVAAQALEPGQRVRLAAPSMGLERFEGRLVRLDGDSLGVMAGDGLRTVPRSAVSGLERYDGVGRRTGRGALVGAAVVAAFVAQDILRKPEQCRGSGNYGQRCTAVLTLSTAAGAGLGALIGAAIRHERWVPVSLGPR